MNEAFIERLRANDDDAWREFRERSVGAFAAGIHLGLRECGTRFVGNSRDEAVRELVNEATSEFYAHSFQGFKEFKTPSGFWSYVTKCAYNYVRTNRGKLKSHGQIAAQQLAAPSASEPNPDQLDLLACISRLTSGLRAVIMLRYGVGGAPDQSTREVAGALGLTMAAVERRLSRAKKKLKECITERRGLRLAMGETTA